MPSQTTTTEKRNTIIIAALVAFTTAAVGGALTHIGPWYFALKQPTWKPPDALFGPAWTFIFICAAASACFAWWATRERSKRIGIAALFVLNAILNTSWSLLFFHLRRPDWAAIEVIFFWCSIAALIVYLYPISRRAAWLLSPYLAWVTFASALNWAIVRLNA